MRRIGAGGPEIIGEEEIGGEMAAVGRGTGVLPRVGKIAARTTAEIGDEKGEIPRGKGGEITGGSLTKEGIKPPARTTGIDRPTGMDAEERAPQECR